MENKNCVRELKEALQKDIWPINESSKAPGRADNVKETKYA